MKCFRAWRVMSYVDLLNLKKIELQIFGFRTLMLYH